MVLLQHRRDLGRKTIRRVAIFKEMRVDADDYSLFFELGSLDEGSTGVGKKVEF